MSGKLVLDELESVLRTRRWSTELAQDVVSVLEAGMGYEFLAVLAVTGPETPLRPLALSEQGHDAAFVETDKAYVTSRCSDPRAGLTNWVARTGRSVCVGDVADDSRYLGIRDAIRSELCVPLSVGDTVVGVVNTETPVADAYTAADRRFLETAGRHVARAIESDRRHGADEDSSVVMQCAWCKKILGAHDRWVTPDAGFIRRVGFRLTHGICPTCSTQMLGRDIE